MYKLNSAREPQIQQKVHYKGYGTLCYGREFPASSRVTPVNSKVKQKSEMKELKSTKVLWL